MYFQANGFILVTLWLLPRIGCVKHLAIEQPRLMENRLCDDW